MRWARITEFAAFGPNARFFAKLNEIIRAVNALRGIDSPNSLTTRDVHGTIKTPKTIPFPQAGGDGMVFKGEWSSENSYSVNEVVLIRGGTTAGQYLSLIDTNTDPPYNSSNWVQLANNNAIGNWT